MIVQAERIESLKIGAIGAFGLFLATGVVTLLNQLLLRFESLTPLAVTDWINLLATAATALIGGFLFGIVYRYAIRSDDNSHIGDGVVFAFGIVRGLAQIQANIDHTDVLLSSGVLGIESILVFACDRYLLDWAFRDRLIKRLK
jgi:Na+-transporting NADH:ubiquinone oxidoreductase subunit NqrE